MGMESLVPWRRVLALYRTQKDSEINAHFVQYSAWKSSKLLSQVRYCRAGDTVVYYVLFENYSNYQCAQDWWFWRRSTTGENKGCNISFLERYVMMITIG